MLKSLNQVDHLKKKLCHSQNWSNCASTASVHCD